MADTRPTHGGLSGRQGLEAGQKLIKGRKADTRRVDARWTRFGGTAKRTQGGHMADKLANAAREHIVASPLLLRENPTVNCLGKKAKQERN